VKNLDRLLTLPFTGLKLDKGIVRLIGTQGPGSVDSRRRVVETGAWPAGLTVVAEGVETREMWDRLRALGVQEAQGYFIARPVAGRRGAGLAGGVARRAQRSLSGSIECRAGLLPKCLLAYPERLPRHRAREVD
jgi:EAL domain-containing protein (putative c-di-GMP-specific phosphodiesterase class I)